MPNYTVAISTDFLNAFAALPKQKQGKVMDFMTKFRSNPMSPGINYEKINDAAEPNIRSVRIDEAYRGIVMPMTDSGIFLLLWVDHHDEAYAWARRKRCQVNPKTGSIQVYESQSAEDKPSLTPTNMQARKLFYRLTEDELLGLGVPAELIPIVRNISDEDGLKYVGEQLPRDAYEALELVAAGFTVEEVANELFGPQLTPKPQIKEDFALALNNPVTQMTFTVSAGEDELKAMMNAPLEKWRVFLHPSQRRIVSRQFSGAARVLGGAGTGKTVVAMHRAKFLAGQISPDKRILFTTFTTNLAQDIQENLRKICTVEEMRHIDVIHLDAFVEQFLRERDYENKIVYDELDDFWAEAEASTGENYDLPKGFFRDEWEKVVQAQGITAFPEYARAVRLGRGIRLDRNKRIAVWRVFEEYMTIMNTRRKRDIHKAMNECCQLLMSQPELSPYISIVVDEGQDFGMCAFRFLRRLAGKEHENDLFIVGDTHQRIYRNRVTLSKCGINVVGRSHQLRLNYRTTEEIRRWAMAVIKGISFDDLDDGPDEGRGYMSLMHGEAPLVRTFDTFDQECTFIVGRVKELVVEEGRLQNICLVARSNKLLDSYREMLTKVHIPYYEIKRSKNDDRNFDGVRLATMHRVKGLEFNHMIIAAVNKGVIPTRHVYEQEDPVTQQEELLGERCLLYVALTRAKKTVAVTSYGKASEFIS